VDEIARELKLNALEREIGLEDAIALYEEHVSRNSDEDDAFERLAIIYRSRNQIEDEIRVLGRAVAYYDRMVFVEQLESRLATLNRLAKRLKTAKSLFGAHENT
jgi:hypothetical protein